jgi:hypothetical protein
LDIPMPPMAGSADGRQAAPHRPVLPVKLQCR